MFDDNFFRLRCQLGFSLEEKSTLDDLIKWTVDNRSLLEEGFYEISYKGVKIFSIFVDEHGILHFD